MLKQESEPTRRWDLGDAEHGCTAITQPWHRQLTPLAAAFGRRKIPTSQTQPGCLGHLTHSCAFLWVLESNIPHFRTIQTQ